MRNNTHLMDYARAIEKIESLLFTIDQTIDYMDEYEINLEDKEKTIIIDNLKKMLKWLESNDKSNSII